MKGNYGIKEKTGDGSRDGGCRDRERGPGGYRAIKGLSHKNQNQSILRAEKRKGLWIGFMAGLTASVFAGMGKPSDSVLAREAAPAICGMSVRDEDMRKLLIRTGAVYEASGPVFIEIPWEMIREEEKLQVEVRAGKSGQEEQHRLSFSCEGKAQAGR